MDYSLREVFLERLGRYYLPLPKLNDLQMQMIAGRLKAAGFRVNLARSIRAALGGRSITVERRGLAWSNMDVVDPLAPIVPSLLRAEKTKVQENPYFMAKRTDGLTRIQLFTRMEALESWSELRRHDLSCLTPDEAAVVASLLKGSRGQILGITDYPRENGRTTRFGKKVYFQSALDIDEFIANLRTMEQKHARNSYLPRNSVIEVQLAGFLSTRRTRGIIDSLGEWCYLRL